MSVEPDWERLVEESEHDIGEAWTPTQDRDCPRTLVGTVVGYKQIIGYVSDYGSDDPWICMIRDRDGKAWSVWLWQDVLFSEFKRWRPMPGDPIVLRYKGEVDKRAQGGRRYHHFTLTVDRGQRGLPGFLTAAPELEPGDDPPATEEQPVDAEVVEEDEQQGDDDVPY